MLFNTSGGFSSALWGIFGGCGVYGWRDIAGDSRDEARPGRPRGSLLQRRSGLQPVELEVAEQGREGAARFRQGVAGDAGIIFFIAFWREGLEEVFHRGGHEALVVRGLAGDVLEQAFVEVAELASEGGS